MATITGRKPASSDLQNIRTIALVVLSLTRAPTLREKWRPERNGVLDVFRAARKPGYYQSEDACWDYDWLVSLLADVSSEAAGVEDVRHAPAYGVSDRDFR